MPPQEGRHPGLVDPAVYSVPVCSRDTRIRLTSQLGLVRHLRQRLAVLLVRDNMAMLLSRSPAPPPPDVDGVTE